MGDIFRSGTGISDGSVAAAVATAPITPSRGVCPYTANETKEMEILPGLGVDPIILVLTELGTFRNQIGSPSVRESRMEALP
jgi:hypothetical protein